LSLGEVALLSLKRKRLRTILLVISVAISISILTGVNAGVDGLQKTYRDMVTTSLGYTGLIVQSNSTSQTLQKSSVEPFLHDESIATYSWRIQYGTPFTSSSGNFTPANWAFIVGADLGLDEEFGNYIMAGGNFSQITEALKSQPDSCVLNEYYAKRMNLKPGDTLYAGSYNISEPVPTEPEKVLQFKVMGIIRDYGRAYWFDPKNPDDFVKINGELFLSLATAQDLFDIPPDNVTQVYVHVTDMTQNDVLKSRLQQNLGSGYSIANLKSRMLASVEQSFANYRSIAAVIGGMSLMIAVMLLLNSMFAAVSERKYDIGVMRSIGASRGQIFLVFMIEVLFIAVAGALLSVPLSVMTTKMITVVMPAPYIQNVGQPSTAVEFVYSPNTVLFATLAGIAITAAIGLIPSIAAARLDIVRALRPRMRFSQISRRWRLLMPVAGLILVATGLYLVQVGFGRTATWIPSATALVGYAATLVGAILLASLALPALSRAFSYLLTPLIRGTAIIVHRNILLNFRRSVFAYGAFAVSIALMISLSSLVTTVASYDLAATKYASGADIQVWVSTPPSFSESLRAVSGVKNVAGVSYIYQSNMSFNGHYVQGENTEIMGINSTEYFQTIYRIHLTATSNGMTPDEVYSDLTAQSGNIILQDSLARNLTSGVGDTVTCMFRNQTNTMEANFKVIATTDFVAGAWQTLYKSASTWGYYVAIVSSADLARYRDPAMGGSNLDQFYVSLASNANTTQVVNDLDQECRTHGYNPSIATAQDSVERTQSSYNQIEVLTLSVTTFSIIISALGIMAAMAYTVLERKREIGVLMALGLDRRQNMALIIGETVLLALLGTIIGIISGVGLTCFVLQVIPWWINIPQPSLILSSSTLLISVSVIVVSALVSSAYPADRVAKLDVVDALRK
jgi:putative ABC transport system permease protein